jgi:hypothetical protein
MGANTRNIGETRGARERHGEKVARLACSRLRLRVVLDVPEGVDIGTDSVSVGGLKSRQPRVPAPEQRSSTGQTPPAWASRYTAYRSAEEMAREEEVFTFSLLSLVVFLILKKTSLPSVLTILMLRVLSWDSQRLVQRNPKTRQQRM